MGDIMGTNSADPIDQMGDVETTTDRIVVYGTIIFIVWGICTILFWLIFSGGAMAYGHSPPSLLDIIHWQVEFITSLQVI